MEGFLQIRQLVFWRYDTADFARVSIGIRRAHHDLHSGIELPYAGCCPHTVLPWRHAHVQKYNCQRLIALERLFDRGYCRLSVLAEDRIECRTARLRSGLLRLRRRPLEEPAAQLAKSGDFLTDIRLQEDLRVSIAHIRLIVGDEHANGRPILALHEDLTPPRRQSQSPVDPAGSRGARRCLVQDPRWLPRSARRARQWHSRTSAVRCRGWFPWTWSRNPSRIPCPDYPPRCRSRCRGTADGAYRHRPRVRARLRPAADLCPFPTP